MWIIENGLNNVSKLTFAAGSFTRTAYPAPSAFGLKGIIVGPDGNVWTVGSNVNRMGRFGTVSPTTTTTTTTLATTTTTTTLAPAPTLPPTTKALTQPVTTKAAAKKKVCSKYAKKKVKVNGKFVTKTVCVAYKFV
jgi:hypothetical protein